MATRTHLDLPCTYDNGSFARYTPFGDRREVIVRRGIEMGTCAYGIEEGTRTATIAGEQVRVTRYHQLLSPPPWTPGAAPVDPSAYANTSDVVYLPDAELLLDRGVEGFSDEEVERVLSAIGFDRR